MASSAKELKALITLAGKIDPSLQKAMLDAASKTRKVSTDMGLLQLMSKKAGGGISKFAQDTVPGVKQLVELRKNNQLVGASFNSLGKLAKIGAKTVAVSLAALTVAGMAAFTAVGKQGLQTASDLAEVQNVVNVSFGENAATIDSWSKSLLNAYGLSELSSKKYSSTLGSMLKSSGIAGDQMLVMSQNLTMLSGDMASFYNLQNEDAFDKLRAGISGETEPLKQLGINMSVANLEAFALSQGIKKNYDSMNQAEQMTLRYNYIMQATSDAQGDFARTSDSMANQQKLIKENFSQLAGKIMTSALPAVSSMMAGLNGMMGSMDTEALGGFVASIADLVVQMMPIAMQLLPIISDALMALLPPLLEIIKLILPPLTEFFKLLVSMASTTLTNMATIIGKIAGFFGGSGGGPTPAPTPIPNQVGGNMSTFAIGGFANRPSIFGEAGLEAAIPIKPGNPRSLKLLARTAELLGIQARKEKPVGMALKTNIQGLGEQNSPSLFTRAAEKLRARKSGSITIHYAPVIRGNKAEIEPLLRNHVMDLRAMLEAHDNTGRRLSFDCE